jgi:hypothetical protein
MRFLNNKFKKCLRRILSLMILLYKEKHSNILYDLGNLQSDLCVQIKFIYFWWIVGGVSLFLLYLVPLVF